MLTKVLSKDDSLNNQQGWAEGKGGNEEIDPMGKGRGWYGRPRWWRHNDKCCSGHNNKQDEGEWTVAMARKWQQLWWHWQQCPNAVSLHIMCTPRPASPGKLVASNLENKYCGMDNAYYLHRVTILQKMYYICVFHQNYQLSSNSTIGRAMSTVLVRCCHAGSPLRNSMLICEGYWRHPCWRQRLMGGGEDSRHSAPPVPMRTTTVRRQVPPPPTEAMQQQCPHLHHCCRLCTTSRTWWWVPVD